MKKQKILCVLLTIILLSGISISSFATDNIQNTENNNTTSNIVNNNAVDELNQQKDGTQEDLDRVSKQLEYIQTEMSYTLLEIQKLDDKIRKYTQEDEELAEKLQKLETSVQEATMQLEKITQEYNKKDEQLKNRLVALYEAGDISYLDVLLSANSLSDFLSRYYTMIEIAEYDNELIDKVGEQRKTIDITKRKIENETAEIKILKAKAEQSKVIVQNTKTLQQGYINTLSESEKKLNKKIEQYKNEVASIEAKIQEVNNLNQEIEIQYTGGKMIWPVAVSGTVITSYYGTREHPIYGVTRFHQGLDIGNAGFGAPAVAVLDGVVTYSGWLGSYGNCVMIYHGDGITTLYAHGQAVLTQRGEQVKQGDVIMGIGSTGNSTGPHLHFEVRVNGKPVNPTPYLP